jgi:hypothetical protein
VARPHTSSTHVIGRRHCVSGRRMQGPNANKPRRLEAAAHLVRHREGHAVHLPYPWHLPAHLAWHRPLQMPWQLPHRPLQMPRRPHVSGARLANGAMPCMPAP